MPHIENAFCPNKDCKDDGMQNHGNMSVRGKYGKDKTKLFSNVEHVANVLRQQELPLFFELHLSDEKIAQIIHHAAEGVGVGSVKEPFNFRVCVN